METWKGALSDEHVWGRFPRRKALLHMISAAGPNSVDLPGAWPDRFMGFLTEFDCGVFGCQHDMVT